MKNNNSKVLKTVLSILAVAAMLLAPVGIIVTLGLALPSQYEKTFTAELPDKLERLESIDEPKIVVIGGSSVAFGLDSELMEEITGMPTVNFGLYASLGTRAMLDLSKSNIGEGDIIILSPETDEQTLSLYFGSEVMWQAIEADRSIFTKLPADCRKQMILQFFNYTANKFRLFLTGTPDPAGVYRHDSFDENGDLSFDRPQSKMKLGFDPGQIIEPTADIVSEDFIDYVNDYVGWAREQGAEVYFTFAPMNGMAMSENVTDESLYDYYLYLSKVFDCEVISDITRSVMDAGYFYDSNFHLNNSGRVVFTAHLAEDILRVGGNAATSGIVLPEPPELPKDNTDVLDDDPNSVYFRFREVRNNEGEIAWYSICGLSEQGLEESALTVPRNYNGVAVRSIDEGAFSGTDLREVTLLDNINSISSGAFANSSSLTKLHIYNEDSSSMAVDQMTLFDGANPSLRIYLYSEESYNSYVSGYFWSNYGGKMILVK